MRLRPPQFRVVALSALSLLAAPRVHASVTEPNGLVVPQPPSIMMGGIALQAFFDGRGENIDAVADAAVEPATFWPRCGALEITLALQGSIAQGGLAWYNVPTSPTAAPAVVYTAYPIGTPGTVSNINIEADPNYAGGAIGFALMKTAFGTTPVYFSEYRRNALCSGCTGTGMTPDHWKLALAYPSRVTAGAIYLAWEDWEGAGAQPSSWFNDGDFNDQVFIVRGARPCAPNCPTSCDAGGTGGSGGGGPGGSGGSGGRGIGGTNPGGSTATGGAGGRGGTTGSGGSTPTGGTPSTGGGGTNAGGSSGDATGGSSGDSPVGGTTSTGGNATGGSPNAGEGGEPVGGSGASSPGSDLGRAVGDARADAPGAEEEGGCGCRLSERRPFARGIALFFAAAAAAAWRRARRRS